MKTYQTLLKLTRQTLDEKRRQLSQLWRKREENDSAVQQLEIQLARETALAGKRPDVRLTFADYQKMVQQKRQSLLHEASQIDLHIQYMEEQVRDVFMELKQYDTMLERKIEEEAQAIAEKEQTELDSIGMELYRRRAPHHAEEGSTS